MDKIKIAKMINKYPKDLQESILGNINTLSYRLENTMKKNQKYKSNFYSSVVLYV